jgi:hypothetical protein
VRSPMRRRDEKGPGGVRRLQHGSGRRLQLSMLCGERVRLWRIPRVLAVRWARRQVPRPRLAGRIMWVGEQVGWIIQGVRRRESVFGGWLLSKLPGVTCVCHVRLSFSLSLSLSHSLTPSLFLRLNAAGSARGGEQTRLTRVLRRRAETARWEGARSVTMGIRWPSTVVTQLVRSSQGTHVCTTSRPTTHAGPTLRGARR